MGRIRTIKPEFPQSESMGRVSREARLCFILLWTIVDDAGKARASSRLLASLLYPYDDDAGKFIDGWLNELEREQCLIRYDVDGNSYIKILKWLNHQKIDHASASRLPDPREDSRILAPDLVPRTSTVVPVPSTEDNSDSHAALLALTPEEPKTAATNSQENFILPEWIPLQLWEDFVENRNLNKNKLTERAKKIAVKKLEGFRRDGYDINAIIEETILNNWKSFFVNEKTPKIPKPKREVHVLTQRELDEQNYRDFGSPDPSEWAPVDAPQGWIPCLN